MYNNPNQPQQPPYGQPPYQQGQPPFQPGPQGQPPFQQGPQPPYGPPFQQPPYGQPSYGVDGIPSVYQTAPPKKKSSALGIIMGIIGGIVAVVVVVGVLILTGVIKIGGNSAAATALTNYYEALKTQNYPTAYTYLDPAILKFQGQTITPTIYSVAEASIDKQLGPVTDFKLTSTTVVDSNAVTITVQETRNQTRTVTYLMKLIGNDWKISVTSATQGLPQGLPSGLPQGLPTVPVGG
jgi:hypothetical protein